MYKITFYYSNGQKKIVTDLSFEEANKIKERLIGGWFRLIEIKRPDHAVVIFTKDIMSFDIEKMDNGSN